MYEQTSNGQADSSVTDAILVYAPRTLTLLFWGVWWFIILGIGSAALTSSQGGTSGSPPPLLVLAVVVLVGVPVCLYQVYEALRHQPYLIINEEGIRLDRPPWNGEVIPWAEIAALRVGRARRVGDCLYLDLRTPTTIPSSQDLDQLPFSMQVPDRDTGDVRLTGQFPSIPPKALLNQIVQRYGHELQTYRVAV